MITSRQHIYRPAPRATNAAGIRVACLALALLAAMQAQADSGATDESGKTAGELERIEVKVSTATRTQRLLTDVPVRTEVLRSEDIALRGALDFSQAAELINGLRVESNCQNCNTTEVQLLGLPGQYNQLLFDGMPLMSTLGGVDGLEQIPAAFVNRSEVVKGGGSSLYGPGAVAGVINLIPERPMDKGGYIRIGADVQRGEPLRYGDARLDTTALDERLGISFAAQAAKGDAVDFNDDGYSEITRKSQRVAGVQLWYAPDDRTTLRANLQWTRERRRGGNRLDEPEYLANIAESLETDYLRGGLRWERVVNDDFDFSLGYSFAHLRRDSFYGGLGDVVTDPSDPAYDPTQLDPNVPGSAAAAAFDQYGYTTNPLHYLDTQFNWVAGAHALSFGVQYKHEAVKDRGRNARGEDLSVLVDDHFTNLGLYVQDEWTVSDALDLVLGARVDKSSSLDDVVLSPRVALAWSPSERTKLRAAISTGFRAPDIFSEDLHVDTLGASPIRIRNTVGLREERAATAMLGFDWRSDAADPVWQWDATASLTSLRDSFVLGDVRTDTDGTLFQIRGNSSGSRVAGVETNIAWKASDTLRLNAGAAWYRSRYDAAQIVFDDTADGGSTVIATRDYLKTPEWTGLAQATWSPSERWDAFLAVRYTGRMSVLNNNAAQLVVTPEFWVTDIGATLHLDQGERHHWDLSFGVKNVFDERQRDIETGANRDSEYVYGPRFARTFHVNLRFGF